MLAENERIGWHPEHIKHGRFGKWLEGNVDWALSRERYWGTPLPIWACTAEDCDERVCVGSLAELGERGGEAPRRRIGGGEEIDLHRPYIDDVVLDCEACGGEMRRVPEVIDTWYDSGAMPFAQFHYPFENEAEFDQRFPADFICEAIDQTRGWFYSQLAESVLLFDQTDYLNCVCLGLILDPEGRKMSKRLDNLVDPHEVIDTHGADAFRWYYLASQQPWAGLPVQRRDRRRVGPPVPADALEHLLVLRALRERRRRRRRSASRRPPRPSSTAGSSRGCRRRSPRSARAPRRLRLDLRRQGDRRSSSTRCRTGTCASRGGASGRATRRRSRPSGSAWPRPRSCSRRSSRSPPTRSGSTSSTGPSRRSSESVHLAGLPGRRRPLRDGELEDGMEAARRAVELGRAARAQAKAKMRQPLAKAVIVATAAERQTIESFAAIVKAELNVRELEFVTEEGELASWSVKPNFPALGPRFGKDMPQVKVAIEALDADHVRSTIDAGGEIGISVDGREHTLGPDDLSFAMRAARRLPGGVGGRTRRRARPRARRRPDPRGPGPRGRPCRPERPQAGGTRDHRPDRARASAATRSCSPQPAPTSPT